MRVVIEVRGGVAYAECPQGVEVEIVDYDDIEAAPPIPEPVPTVHKSGR